MAISTVMGRLNHPCQCTDDPVSGQLFHTISKATSAEKQVVTSRDDLPFVKLTCKSSKVSVARFTSTDVETWNYDPPHLKRKATR